MSNRTFQRAPNHASQIHPGQYVRSYDMGGGLATLAILRCPTCLRAFSINKRDENPIDENGQPAKPVSCKHCGETCAVRLADWNRTS